MALVRNYGFQTASEDEFEFNFEIPVNCNFTTSYDAGKNLNTVTVQLNSGQTQPSSTYSMEYYTFTASGGALDVCFEQVQSSGTIIKPKVVINC